MGKRKRLEKTEKIKKKIRKLEEKLQKTINERNSSDEDVISVHMPPSLPPENPALICFNQNSSESQNKQNNMFTADEEVPEELLIALGSEGEETTEIGNPILEQLSGRWTKIMTDGLNREARENIIKKYKTPSNFPAATAPIMNPEIAASLSDTSIKRDRRILLRQNILGKTMACIGQALTDIMKGNIHSKELVEKLSDAAKITAEIFHQDSLSRKFFALAGATPAVKNAVKDTTTDEYLFGKGCGDKIKSAQVIQKTGSQIKDKKKQEPRKVNWKSPLQPQQQVRNGPSHHQPAISRPNQQPPLLGFTIDQ